MRTMYNLMYRYSTPPWVLGARAELKEAVTSGRLHPGRAIDLGCGEGDNAIYLAERGFEVTGVDYAEAAIDKARAKAARAGVTVDFQVGDLTELVDVDGPFDVLVDYGVYDDLRLDQRPLYVRTVERLVRPGSQFFFWCFEWELKGWERLMTRKLSGMALEPGEVNGTFGAAFDIERVAGSTTVARTWPRGFAAYLMTAKAHA